MYRALSLSVALGVGLLASVPAVAADKVTWNISLYGPPRAATVTFEHLAKVAKEKSGGNFLINLKYNEQLGEATDFLDGIKVDSSRARSSPIPTPLQRRRCRASSTCRSCRSPTWWPRSG